MCALTPSYCWVSGGKKRSASVQASRAPVRSSAAARCSATTASSFSLSPYTSARHAGQDNECGASSVEHDAHLETSRQATVASVTTAATQLGRRATAREKRDRARP